MKIALMVIGALIATTAIMMIKQNLTTPSNLGVNNGQLAPMPDSPNAVSSQTDVEDKKVAALPFNGDATTTMNTVKQVLNEMGSNRIQVVEPDYLHTEFITPTMRYRDDVEFYLDDQSRQLHFRSASRVGHSDLGANRQRYESFSKRYQQLSQAIAGAD